MAFDLTKLWYRKSLWPWLLLPLSGLFRSLVALRRMAYRSGLLRSQTLPVPVIVVGNISVGGTGKTPLVAWLARFLQQQGYRPGIVSRGYRGRARHWPQQVRPDSDPCMVGDEAVLLARRSGCPMAVGPDRVAAARALLEHSDCNLILSDDGLQHYALARDIEIAVVDGVRRFGNGHCLPAGPLREPVSRLEEVDMVVSNGLGGRLEYPMKLRLGEARQLLDPAVRRPLDSFRTDSLCALAGIGHPRRFFTELRRHGLKFSERAFPDHHAFSAAELDCGPDVTVLMTEKDAVKCSRFAGPQHWYIPVDAEPVAAFGQRLLALLDKIKPG